MHGTLTSIFRYRTPLFTERPGGPGSSSCSRFSACHRRSLRVAPDDRARPPSTPPISGRCSKTTASPATARRSRKATSTSRPSLAGRRSLRSRKLWKSAIEQLTSEEMPPDEAKHQPTAAERERLVAWMKRVAEVDPADPANHDPGPPVLRRLTVVEYNHTMRDLLGIDFDISQTVGMPADTATLGFNNLAAGLDISSPLFEKYLAAADRAWSESSPPPTRSWPTSSWTTTRKKVEAVVSEAGLRHTGQRDEPARCGAAGDRAVRPPRLPPARQPGRNRPADEALRLV